VENDTPPPVNLNDAVTSLRTPSPVSEESTAPPKIVDRATVSPTVAVERTSRLGSIWVVSTAGESFAGYRVGEELVGIGTQMAVGRTSEITGILRFDGKTITAVDIEVNLVSLQSDDSRRDRQLRRRGLETNRFPVSIFTLTDPILVGPIPSEGESFAAITVGELTLHGVTRVVSIDLSGQLVGALVVVVGSTEVQFADFGIVPPTSLKVLSVDDHGTLEFQVTFESAN
jgi:polyisoprenoid-binding protein YceI